MNASFSRRIAPALLAVGMAGGVVAATGGIAFAAAKTATHSASGAVKTVDAKGDKFGVKVGTKTDTFKITSATTFTVAGKTSSLAALKSGENVVITYTVSGKTWNAVTVTAKTA